jgi:sarcosine oxidase subunit gamma
MAELASRRPPLVASRDWLRALPPLKRWVLHGEERARELAAPLWGVGFSQAPCRALRQGTRATLWLGPDEHLLLDLSEGYGEFSGLAAAPPGTPLPEFEAALEPALAGTRHALIDLSHRQVALEVRGEHAATLLSGACPLDLDLAAFPVGMCTRTVLAKADIVLWRTDIARFHLEAWRSFIPYVTALLAEIALEFYPS